MHCLPEKGRVVPTQDAVWNVSEVVDVLEELFRLIQSLVVAVLDVGVVRPALEEPAQIAAKTADAAPVIDLSGRWS